MWHPYGCSLSNMLVLVHLYNWMESLFDVLFWISISHYLFMWLFEPLYVLMDIFLYFTIILGLCEIRAFVMIWVMLLYWQVSYVFIPICEYHFILIFLHKWVRILEILWLLDNLCGLVLLTLDPTFLLLWYYFSILMLRFTFLLWNVPKYITVYYYIDTTTICMCILWFPFNDYHVCMMSLSSCDIMLYGDIWLIRLLWDILDNMENDVTNVCHSV